MLTLLVLPPTCFGIGCDAGEKLAHTVVPNGYAVDVTYAHIRIPTGLKGQVIYMAKRSGNRSGGGRNQSGGKGRGSGKGSGGLPSKTGNPSGGGRTNAPPKGGKGK